MTLHPETERTQPTAPVVERTHTEWLEDLAAGECTWENVFRGVLPFVNANPETGWELLSLVDQYYRRHKIGADDFHGLNTNLQQVLIGNSRTGDVIRAPELSPPPSAPPTPTAAPVAPPVVTPALPAVPVAQAPVIEPVAAAPLKTFSHKAEPIPIPSISLSDVPEVAPEPAPLASMEFGRTKPRVLVVDEVLRNRYRIRGILGHGGMGTVYAAVDEFRIDHADGGQNVAIKVLHTQIAQRPALLAELRSEFQRLQSLSHPNIVRVHEFDRDGDLTFFTMEQLSGASLTRVLANQTPGPLDRRFALAIIRQVGEAVVYAHSRGVVHGDLNPGNVFITEAGEIRVLDFGASYRLHRDPYIPDLDDLSRTAVATPSYSSCEVLQGSPANVRDDVYAMSCLSYVVLTGKHPFRGQNALQARTARMSVRRPPGLSQRQWRALRDGLQFDPQRRPGDMAAWLDDLAPITGPMQLPALHTVMTARPQRVGPPPWLTAAAIAIVAALLWWGVENSDQVKTFGRSLVNSASQTWDTSHEEVEQAPPPAPASREMAPTTAPTVTTTAPPAVVATAPVITAKSARRSAPPTAPVARVVPPASPAADASAPGAIRGGHARIDLAADVVDVAPADSVATVIVQRHESYRNDVSFTWWTESGTAKAGQDFVPVKARTDFIPGGDKATQLLIPVVSDPRRHIAKSFYVVIDQPSEGAHLGSRTLTQVTIQPSP